METRPLNLKDLFRREVRFVVPLFQRPYVWTKEANWEPLWDDLLAALEPASNSSDASHFLGAVVLDHVRGPLGTTEVRQVVDGQQRLTTLQLLLAAIRDLAQASDLPDRFYRSLYRLTVNDDEMSDDPDQIFKVWPTNADRAPFRDAMSAGSEAELLRRYPSSRPTIVQAYLFFADQANAWAASMSDADLAKAFERLVEVLNTGMYAVVINLDGGDNPQVIFESLNARGTPLRASDLVRNHVFHACDQEGLPVQKLYEQHWARFDDGYWREEVSQGRLFRPRLDAFLGHFLTMELGREVPAAQLFMTFRTYLKQPARPPLPELLARFARYGDIYSGLDTGAGLDAYERGFADRLRALDTSVIHPVLLRLLGGYGPDARRPAIAVLDSFLMRRMICQYTSKNYNRLMLDLLQRLGVSTQPPGDVVREFFAGQTAQSNHWPSDDDIRHAATARRLYRAGNKRRLRLILGLVEQHSHTAKTERVVRDLDNLTVEHLLPQSWEAHWPVAPGDELKRRHDLVDTLGNLTLATQHLNAALSNGPWPAKRAALLEHSALNINRTLPNTWGHDEIEARAGHLANVLCRALPRPPATTNTAEKPDTTERLADVEAEVEAEVERAMVHEAPRRRNIGLHIQRVLQARPAGTVLTVSQLASATSEEYPTGAASPGAIRERLNRGTVSGVEATTNQAGHLAGTLVNQPTPATSPQPAPAAAAAPITAQQAVPRTAPAVVDVARLQIDFHTAMVNVYARARDEAGYKATFFLRMVAEQGGLEAARQLLHSPAVSDGFRALWERGRLDLTVEALVLEPKYRDLFTAEERQTAQQRLKKLGR